MVRLAWSPRSSHLLRWKSTTSQQGNHTCPSGAGNDSASGRATLPEMAPDAVISTPELVLATPTPPRLGAELQDPAILTPEFVLATATPPRRAEGNEDHTDGALTAATASNASPDSSRTCRPCSPHHDRRSPDLQQLDGRPWPG